MSIKKKTAATLFILLAWLGCAVTGGTYYTALFIQKILVVQHNTLLLPAQLMEVQFFLAAALILVLIPALLALWLLGRRLGAPLAKLTEYLYRLPQLKGKERRLELSTGDELELLADGVSDLVAELDRKEELLRDYRWTEERLRLYSHAVEQSASSIVISDLSGTISYVNRKFCEVTGYLPEEVLGHGAGMLKSGMQPPPLFEEIWRTITSGKEWHGELHSRRKDGTYFWENATISPIFDEGGRVTHYLSTKEDITARREANRQLRRNQAELVLKHEQLRTLFRQVEQGKLEWEQTMDCIDDVVVLVNSAGRIRRCNRAFLKLADSGSAEVISRDWTELARTLELPLECPGALSGEVYHAASERWFALKCYPYGDGGQVVTLHDTTEIKQVSEKLASAYGELKATHSQLLQQEKMASIGQLAAGVAHEINNPMGFISSNLSTMEKYLERLEGYIALQGRHLEGAGEAVTQELREARRKYKVDYVLSDARSLLQESRDGAERVRTIVQNLKSFSHVDEAQAKRVDINQCLESTITIAWNELKYKTTLNRDYGELPAVPCRPQQLNQVFLNILVNAAHAIEKQGEITVRSWQEGESVCVAISDTGCGIPEEIRNRIFEPFFTTKEVGKGTGLGLSISYDIIKKHGGTIEVDSVLGSGTTFTVRLPLQGEPA